MKIHESEKKRRQCTYIYNTQTSNMFAMWVVLNTWKPQGREFCFRIHVWWNFGQQLGPHQTISDYIMLVVTGLSWPIYSLQRWRTEKSPFWVSAWSIARCEEFTIIYTIMHQESKGTQTNMNPPKKKEKMSTHLHIDRISIDMLDLPFFSFFFMMDFGNWEKTKLSCTASRWFWKLWKWFGCINFLAYRSGSLAW